jgi:type I restriction enzyme S subunit
MMKAYPEYKTATVKGVDEIPLQWNPMKFRHLFTIGRGLGITKENLQETGIPCVNYGEIHSKYGFELDIEKHPLKCVSEEYISSSPNSLLNKGDLVFADTSEDLEGSGNFTQLVSDDTTFAGYHTIIARQLKNHDNRFLAYALDSEYYRNQVRRAVKGVKVFSITQAILKDTSILLPSIEEQKAISSYLDVNTDRIDSLISEKENFLKLLSEKRQALISHVVTKGLNPSVPMKDSGVEWIGDIPMGWEAVKLKYLCKLQTGNKNTEDAKPEAEYDFFVRSQSVKKINSYSADCEAILTAGDGVGVGKVYHYVNGKFDYHQRVYMMNNFKRVTGKWFFYYLSSMFHKVAMDGGSKSTVDSLRMPVFTNFMICIPPIEEQENLVREIASQSYNIDKLIKETNNSIELLKEHRTALISAAVTGKIDVREMA